MTECNSMDFPDTFEEFVKSYGIKDSKEVYTNGSVLIPVFRVKQWLDHINTCEDCVSRQAVLDGVDRYIYKSQSTGTQDDFYSFAELVVKALPSVTPKQRTGKWIPLTWDESKCESSYPDDMDGCWAIFTDGKNMSIERGKNDAIDHFFPSGRWFEMSDAVAWMPLPKWNEEGEGGTE